MQHANTAVNLVISWMKKTRKPSLEVAQATLGTFFFTCDRELWPMTLNFELSIDSVKLSHLAKYIGQRSFILKERQTQTPDSLLYLDHLSIRQTACLHVCSASVHGCWVWRIRLRCNDRILVSLVASSFNALWRTFATNSANR